MNPLEVKLGAKVLGERLSPLGEKLVARPIAFVSRAPSARAVIGQNSRAA
jgi:hypothetical protein